MGSSSGPALASSHVPALSLGQDLVLAEGSPFDFGQFLDRFYLSRVGMRVLVGQHIMLHHPQDGFIGIIQTGNRPKP